MKYGLNNWSRVASLLVRKTARQCKSRWYEWLDPSVKKTAWSKTEDEKLLHLVKLFPTQWKTIAEGVGRTAIQCTERYYELVDLANGLTPGENDPRNLRPGEIDPNPEAKPARADPKDLDEDEKEMLAEARARLANTRGKKAKRKAREKQLEEARRVAMLQKRRELKAAGISISGFHVTRNKGDIDYQSEIPFEHKPLMGFHRVGPDETPELKNEAANMRLQQIEELQARDRERRLRLQDRRILKKLHEQNLPAALEKVAERSNPFLYRKRGDLILPEPMVGEEELTALATSIQEVTSQGKGIEDQKSGLLKGVAGTEHLLPSANLPKGATPMTTLASMTPMVSATATGVLRQKAIMQEARNALARQQMNTPLEGGETSIEETITQTPQRKRAPMTPITTTSILTGKQLFTPTTGVDSGIPSRKRKREKVSGQNRFSVDELLASLPSAQNTFDTFVAERYKDSNANENDMDDFEEDERDKEARLKRRKEEYLAALATIHTRVKMFTDFYPRPMDLPENVEEVVAILERARKGLNDDLDYIDRLSRRLEIPVQRCAEVTAMLDKQVASMIVDDTEFLSPDDHLRLFSDPSTIDKSSAVARSFLKFAAQKDSDLGYRTQQMAGEMLDEHVSMLARDIDEEAVTALCEAVTSDPSRIKDCHRMLIYTPSGCVSLEQASVLNDATVRKLFVDSINDEAELEERLVSFQKNKIQKLKGRREKLIFGYSNLQKQLLGTLDQLYHRLDSMPDASY